MKNKILRFLTPILALWMDTSILFPITLSLYLYALTSLPFAFFGALLVSAYLIGAVTRKLLIQRNRMVSLLLIILISLGFAILSKIFFTELNILSVVFYGLLISVSGCRGVFVAERPLISSFAKIYCYSSLGLYFSFYYLYGKIIATRNFQHYLLIGGLITIPTIFLLTNSELINEASREELKDSTSLPVVRKNNRILIAITIVISLVVAGFQTIKDTFLYVVKAIVSFIIYVIKKLMELRQTTGGGQGGPSEEGAPALPPAEARPPSPFWDAVVQIIGTIFLIALLLFAIYFFTKQLIKLWRFIIAQIKKLMESGRWSGVTSDEYDDERESLLDWQSIRQNYADSLRNWWEGIRSSEPKWSQLTDNRQRVRFLYRQLIFQAIDSGFRFSSYRTPRETIHELVNLDRLDQDTAVLMEELYGEARYGEELIKDAQVDKLRNDISNKKEIGRESE